MKEQIEMLKEFHKKFQLTIKEAPEYVDEKDLQLRDNLIEEEANEFITSRNLRDRLDALCDLLYVTLGAGITYGFDLEAAFAEVHRSNMTKLWTHNEAILLNHNIFDLLEVDPNGERPYLVKRKLDGKVVKSPSYSPANLEQFL